MHLIHEAQQHSLPPDLVENSNNESVSNDTVSHKPSSDNSNSSSNILACLTTQSSNQGDLHKVLSSSSKKNNQEGYIPTTIFTT